MALNHVAYERLPILEVKMALVGFADVIRGRPEAEVYTSGWKFWEYVPGVSGDDAVEGEFGVGDLMNLRLDCLAHAVNYPRALVVTPRFAAFFLIWRTAERTIWLLPALVAGNTGMLCQGSLDVERVVRLGLVGQSSPVMSLRGLSTMMVWNCSSVSPILLLSRDKPCMER